MRSLFLLSFLLVATFANAQQTVGLDYYLPENLTYNKNIPTPKEIIGHEVGEWHVTHDKLVFYMTALAKASERVSLINRGITFEGRPLLLLTITSEGNHSRLEEIRNTKQI